MRRTRKAVAELIDDDDEILAGVERSAGAVISLLDDLVCSGVPGWDKDGVIFGGIERAEDRVGKSAAADGPTVLQIQVTDIEQFVRAVYLLRVVTVIDH